MKERERIYLFLHQYEKSIENYLKEVGRSWSKEIHTEDC